MCGRHENIPQLVFVASAVTTEALSVTSTPQLAVASPSTTILQPADNLFSSRLFPSQWEVNHGADAITLFPCHTITFTRSHSPEGHVGGACSLRCHEALAFFARQLSRVYSACQHAGSPRGEQWVYRRHVSSRIKILEKTPWLRERVELVRHWRRC